MGESLTSGKAGSLFLVPHLRRSHALVWPHPNNGDYLRAISGRASPISHRLVE